MGSNEEKLLTMPPVIGRNWLRPAFLFAGCIAAAVSYSWFAFRVYEGQRLAGRSDAPSIENAIALAPANASYHDLLCRRMTFISQSPESAVSECRRASELNPYDSTIWLDLAQAYYSTGNNQLSEAAIQRALAVDPTTPNTAWNAANFFLLQGDTAKALQQFAMILREDPSLAPPVLNACWRSLHDVDRIRSILPRDPVVYLDFLRLLLSSGDLGSAGLVWSALMQLDVPFDFHGSLFYIDRLLQAKEVTRANEAWQDLASRSKELKAYSESDNLITDPSFAYEILNSGFDWRYTPRPQITVTLDNSVYHTRNRSLKIVYSQNGSDAGISQYIAAEPDTRYRLTAWVRSDDLESANGPVLSMLDAYDGTTYGITEETLGTTPWRRVQAEFRSRHDSRLLLFTVQRRPGESRIQGRFWIDDIRLVALPAQEEGR
jgi:tetratricopeptide (TPR) repeat protein